MRISEALTVMEIRGWSIHGDETIENLVWFENEAGFKKPDKEGIDLIISQAVEKKERLKKVAEIKEKLKEIDMKSIRPQREGEVTILEQLTNEAVSLRNQLREIEK